MDTNQYETDRLRLRLFQESDLTAYAEMLSDAETVKYIGEGKTMNRGQAWRSIAMVLGHWHLRGFGLWAVELKETAEMIGRVGLFQPEGWPGLELGWTLVRSKWGNGYAYEAAVFAKQYAKDQLNSKKLLSLIHPQNKRSIQLATRLGMTAKEGDLMDFQFLQAQIYRLSF